MTTVRRSSPQIIHLSRGGSLLPRMVLRMTLFLVSSLGVCNAPSRLASGREKMLGASEASVDFSGHDTGKRINGCGISCLRLPPSHQTPLVRGLHVLWGRYRERGTVGNAKVTAASATRAPNMCTYAK